MPERILWKHIRNKQLGYKFRRQHGISKYVVDFYCSPIHLVVEVDGMVHGEETVAERDIIRENFFKNLGLHIKRYMAKDINSNLELVLNDLKDQCDKLCGKVSTLEGKPHPTSSP